MESASSEEEDEWEHVLCCTCYPAMEIHFHKQIQTFGSSCGNNIL